MAKIPQKAGKGRKQCPECKKYVAARANDCPHCEYNFKPPNKVAPPLPPAPDTPSIVQHGLALEDVANQLLLQKEQVAGDIRSYKHTTRRLIHF